MKTKKSIKKHAKKLVKSYCRDIVTLDMCERVLGETRYFLKNHVSLKLEPICLNVPEINCNTGNKIAEKNIRMTLIYFRENKLTFEDAMEVIRFTREKAIYKLFV